MTRRWSLRERVQIAINPYEYTKKECGRVIETIIEEATGEDVTADCWTGDPQGMVLHTSDGTRYFLTALEDTQEAALERLKQQSNVTVNGDFDV